MHKHNPLIPAVLNLLKTADNPLSLYSLMQSLESQGFMSELDDENLTSEMKLFRKNFIVMNALYELQSDIERTGYALYISSLKIILFAKNHACGLPAIDIEEAQRVDLSMGEYYRNWDNYHATDQVAVERLLNSFWQKYQQFNAVQHDQDKRSCALQLLEVESSASWEDIQRAYRKKATCCHPDKGGTAHQFIQLREAYQFLKLVYCK